MMKATDQRKATVLIFSLFVHATLLVLFVFFAFPKRIPLFFKKQESDLPAALKPHLGSLHGTILFDEPNATQPYPEQNTQQETQKREEPDPQKSQQLELKKTPQGRSALSDKELQQLALASLYKPKPPIQQKQPSNYVNVQPGGIQRHLSIPMGVSGIDKSMGRDLAIRNGDELKLPSLEDLKYVSYLRNVARGLEAELYRFLSTMKHARGESVDVYFKINKQGTLISIESTSSRALFTLERALKQTVQASAPFPPIPHHFSKHELIFRIESTYKTHMQATLFLINS